MSANVYEGMYLLDTTRVGGDVHGAADQLHHILEKHGAEILASRPWDERRLMYPIGHHKKGLYYLIYFRAESTKVPPMERDYQLNEMVIRTLILKLDPKMVDTMLALARDEHALVALHNYQEETTGEEPAGDRRGGRREGRDFDRRDEKVGARE